MNDTQIHRLMDELDMAITNATQARELFLRCQCVTPGQECDHRIRHRLAPARLEAAKTAIREALRSKACPECGRKEE